MNPSRFGNAAVQTGEGKRMILKAVVQKSTQKIILALVAEDFIDFLLSFLTFPLGGVLHTFDGCSSLPSFDNLYKSMMNDSKKGKYFRSQAVKDILSNPQCSPQYGHICQILPIEEAKWPKCYCATISSYSVLGLYTGFLTEKTDQSSGYKYSPVSFVDPRSPTSGYAKGPSMYMVTDDLVVTPMSTVSAASILKRSKVPPSDMEQKVFKIGAKEVRLSLGIFLHFVIMLFL